MPIARVNGLDVEYEMVYDEPRPKTVESMAKLVNYGIKRWNMWANRWKPFKEEEWERTPKGTYERVKKRLSVPKDILTKNQIKTMKKLKMI